MDGIVYEFNDGSGAWLIDAGAAASPSEREQLRRSCQREHARRVRAGLPCAGVLRVRRAGESVCNEIQRGAGVAA